MSPADATIRAGLFAVGAAAIAAFTSVMVTNRSVYAGAVTTTRLKWIEQIRNNLIDFIGLLLKHVRRARYDTAYRESAESFEAVAAVNRAIAAFQLQVNPFGAVGKNVAEILNLCVYCSYIKDRNLMFEFTSSAIAKLELHAQWLIDSEWRVVKLEASGPFSWPLIWLGQVIQMRKYEMFCDGEGSVEALITAAGVPERLNYRGAEDSAGA